MANLEDPRDNRYEFLITNTLKLTIEVNEFGKHLQLRRNSEWISISTKAWSFLNENVGLIHHSFYEHSGYGLLINASGNIKLSQVDHQPYLTLCETKTKDGEVYDTHINLNHIEWDTIRSYSKYITYRLNDCIVYKRGNAQWNLLPEMVEGLPGELKRKLAPKLCEERIVLQLNDFLGEGKLPSYLNTENCYGCLLQNNEQKSHMHCPPVPSQEWINGVILNIESVKHNAYIKDALKILNWEMNWNTQPRFPELNKSNWCYYLLEFRHCNRCEYDVEIIELYSRLFTYLKLDEIPDETPRM